MIGQLTGSLAYQEEKFIILSVGGVGYKVFVAPETLAAAAASPLEISLWTHLVVKEDALDLYGFRSRQELDFFELLITVSGIGPRSALGILSLAGPETLHKAILSGNTDYLTKVSGIGKKSADKIVLELKDKLEKLGAFLPEEISSDDADVLNALQALGYSIKEAREAAKSIPPSAHTTSEKIKLALKYLGR